MPEYNHKRIWWLASYPKSGNTWLRAFLCAYITGQVDINKLNWTLNDLEDYFHQICSPLPLEDVTYEQMALLHPAALFHLSHIQPGPVFVKTHNCNSSFYGQKLLPNSLTKGAVYIVRDPRDVACSWASHKGAEIDQVINDMADAGKGIIGDNRMPHAVTTWNSHVKSFVETEDFPVLVVRYEDMISTPLGAFEDIVRFLELDMNRDKLESAVELSSFKNLQKQEMENGFRERMHGQFFNKGQAGRWAEVLTTEQRIKIETDQAEGMGLLGYERHQNKEVA